MLKGVDSRSLQQHEHVDSPALVLLILFDAVHTNSRRIEYQPIVFDAGLTHLLKDARHPILLGRSGGQ